MATITNITAPTQAIVGKRVYLTADIGVGAGFGEALDITWEGTAPGMPYHEALGFGILLLGAKETIYFSFVMPDAVVKFHIEAKTLDCYFCRVVKSPSFTIEPSKESVDPGEKPSDIIGDISKLFGGISSNLLWIILGLAMLLTIGYIVRKKSTGKLKP